MGWGGLFDYSVKPGPDFSRFRIGLVRLVTRSAKARFGQVGDQVRKVKDQVDQGQGQELDNIMVSGCYYGALMWFDQQLWGR